ncbi:MAG: roadblock/LC7 domain-containing protein [archaeon]|jgi:predicted regulator of Ras-like GTPase activity (Roadblock/LC7/MglB family)
MLAKNIRMEKIDDLLGKLQDLKKQEGIIGYIIRGPETAAIDIKDPTKIIEYASLSSTAFEVSNDIAKTMETGEVNDLVVESENTKLLCMIVKNHRVSVFMEKNVKHDKVCNDLKSS